MAAHGIQIDKQAVTIDSKVAESDQRNDQKRERLEKQITNFYSDQDQKCASKCDQLERNVRETFNKRFDKFTSSVNATVNSANPSLFDINADQTIIAIQTELKRFDQDIMNVKQTLHSLGDPTPFETVLPSANGSNPGLRQPAPLQQQQTLFNPQQPACEMPAPTVKHGAPRGPPPSFAQHQRPRPPLMSDHAGNHDIKKQTQCCV